MPNTPHDLLAQKLKEATAKVAVGQKYCHYKNPDRFYEVIALGFQEASEDLCVVYKSLYGEGFVWVRNLDDWLSTVETDM
ncbi:DUF1653 domain-containing protein, partial [candidate division WWE3 bacterium]|nr:DUF1653 domain-containing protein [candidate division WWE3 bacterium]